MNEETGYAINKQVAEALGYVFEASEHGIALMFTNPQGDRGWVSVNHPNHSFESKHNGLRDWSTDLSAAMSFVRQLAPDAVIEFAPRTANIEVNARESYFSGKGDTDAERLCWAGLKLAAALKKKEGV